MIARRPMELPEAPAAEAALRPGAGVLLGRNRLGTWVDVPRTSADFSHPWRVSVAGAGARIGRGYVIGRTGAVEPRIGKVRISGEEGKPAPVLKLDNTLLNDLKESWICVEVTPDAEGMIESEEATVEVVQRKTPFVVSGKTGRAPLAIIIWKETRWEVWQVVHFHLQYNTSEGDEGRKHFFT